MTVKELLMYIIDSEVSLDSTVLIDGAYAESIVAQTSSNGGHLSLRSEPLEQE